ncbi:cytochrome b5-like [Diprion similis]|uniref:cytochrome b5-like n=1 Tax=Diprion similis TaxID=362088 RepID=UPI001EF96901|nr:cytochrome b5-like [Diprion similis]
MASGKKLFTRKQVEESKEQGTNLFILHDKVYDVGPFLNEHPGGEEVLSGQRNKDGSEAFDDVGHSEDAKEMMEKYEIGEIVESERLNIKPKKVEWVAPKPGQAQKTEQGSGLPYGLIAVAIVVVIIAFNLGFFSSSDQ